MQFPSPVDLGIIIRFLFFSFFQTIQQRGGAIIKARKLSSAMSAAKAICDHLRDWWFGTKPVSQSHDTSCDQSPDTSCDL